MSKNRHKGTVLYARIIDGSLNPPIADGALAFEDELIAWVGPRKDLPAQFRLPDYAQQELPGRSLLPGLIDGHIHISFGEARSEEELALYTPIEYRTLKAAANARRVLQAGVTSAFDAATTYNIAANVRDAIDAGMFPGPRLSVCGRQLTSHQGLEDSFPNDMEFPPGQAGVLIKSRDDLVEQIRYQVKDRVDCIKVSGSNDSLITPDSLDGAAFSDEEFAVIARECRRLGVLSSVHARSRDSVLGAARAKFDVIFHASYIDSEGIDLCLEHGIVITPTFTLLANIINSSQDTVGASGTDACKRELEAGQLGLSAAYKAGVPLIAGSESGWSLVPYGQWHAYEMELFVKMLGMTPLQAIHSGTLAASKALRRFGSKVGKLEPGRYADLMVVRGDPTADITVLQKKSLLEAVFKGGQNVDLTPAPRPEPWYFERHKMFLNGRFDFDESRHSGFIVP